MNAALALTMALSLSSLGAVAQQLLTVPASAAASDGNAFTWLPGCGDSGATQVIIDASHLQTLVGRTLVGLSFRRDGTWLEGLPRSDAHWRVRLGPSTRGADDPYLDFALNLPQGTVAFDGAVSMPAMPPITGYVGWTAPHTVEIAFTTSFTYSGGPLAIELEGSLTTPAAFFPMDGVDDPVRGAASDVGTACGPRAPANGRTALAVGGGLVPGATAQLHLLGTAGNAAFAFFGVSLLPQPVNLTLIGAPGCQWYVDAFTALAAPVVASGIPAVDGLASVRLHLPGTPTLLGGQLVVQWLEVGAGLVATSQAMSLSISAQMPALGMAQLERLSDGSVHVAPASGPVIGFRWL
ncbi:MAG: hypothetical protein HZB39_06270 [Planctomycetes bacterium]|nr:hypothetical protein [Planctomycetota bacterium]